MMLVDITLVNTYHKPYADSTLNNMKKSALIEYVRMLEYNYNVAVSFNKQQAKNFEKMLEQKHGLWRWCGTDKFNDAYECSNCGKILMDDSKYCPNCGAKMDGDT